ncbi:unnamed protein product [Rotaria magnacalcarata]|uniref:Uncharacterized protein n=1 Tax=Rotaria magnacalcarata TaxID=392030 RepID=A0A815EIJ5_9BILA|nr:unnamed protein product [Rotaria magnacalcarata]
MQHSQLSDWSFDQAPATLQNHCPRVKDAWLEHDKKNWKKNDDFRSLAIALIKGASIGLLIGGICFATVLTLWLRTTPMTTSTKTIIATTTTATTSTAATTATTSTTTVTTTTITTTAVNLTYTCGEGSAVNLICNNPMVLHIVEVEINAQTCKDAVQYEQCSSNIGCGCLPLINTDNSSICAFLHIKCSELNSCANNNRTCYRPDHLCVKHSRCHSVPLCYPADMTSQALCPPSTTIPPPVVPDDGICANATWNPNGLTVAGGNGEGSELNQLRYPWGFFVDDDAAVYVADTWNFRVVVWALTYSDMSCRQLF